MSDINNKDPLILYVLVRNGADLPSMRYKDGYGGKALAQANHVGSLFSEHEIVRPLLQGMSPNADVMSWRDSQNTPDDPLGFGTCLTIDVPDRATMEAVVEAALKLNFIARVQVDPSYPLIVPNELHARLDPKQFTLPSVSVGRGQTLCFVEEFPMAYVFGRKSQVSVLLSRFSLAPND